MTTPSRKSAIRRRWARARKITTLRKHYLKATNEGDKRAVLEKLQRLMPPMSTQDFLAPISK